MSQTQLLTLETVSDGPPLPATIGKYRVLGRLGEGATSEVFLAFDDFKGRKVAIKRVRAAALGDPMTDAHYSERFFAAEAALVGRLQHPNAVQSYDRLPDPTCIRPAPCSIPSSPGGQPSTARCSRR